MAGKSKINKAEFLARCVEEYGADDKDVTLENVEKFFDIITSCIKDVVMNGNELNLTKFGTFYLQKHKGHPVQFDKTKSGSVIDDYYVFKFSASDVLNMAIRQGLD